MGLIEDMGKKSESIKKVFWIPIAVFVISMGLTKDVSISSLATIISILALILWVHNDRINKVENEIEKLKRNNQKKNKSR
jgi:hypothetical protein